MMLGSILTENRHLVADLRLIHAAQIDGRVLEVDAHDRNPPPAQQNDGLIAGDATDVPVNESDGQDPERRGD